MPDTRRRARRLLAGAWPMALAILAGAAFGLAVTAAIIFIATGHGGPVAARGQGPAKPPALSGRTSPTGPPGLLPVRGSAATPAWTRPAATRATPAAPARTRTAPARPATAPAPSRPAPATPTRPPSPHPSATAAPPSPPPSPTAPPSTPAATTPAPADVTGTP